MNGRINSTRMTKLYVVLEELETRGETFLVGSELELTDEEALILDGKVRLVDEDEEEDELTN